MRARADLFQSPRSQVGIRTATQAGAEWLPAGVAPSHRGAYERTATVQVRRNLDAADPGIQTHGGR